MPVYVLYGGRLIDKRDRPLLQPLTASNLPAPSVMTLEAYPSPIDGSKISSHRQRDRDLANSGSYDPRDTPQAFRRARDVRHQQRRRTVPTEP